MNKLLITRNTWRGMVRDYEGRWLKYKGIKSSISKSIYFWGKQDYKWLSKNHNLVSNYLLSQLLVQNEILKEDDSESVHLKNDKTFLAWLKKLHKLAAYKGEGAEFHHDSSVARTNHSKVIYGSVKNIAKKLGDGYSKTTSGPNFSFVPKKGNPYDKVISKKIIEHYYPSKKYFSEYVMEMHKSYKKTIDSILSKKSKKTIIYNLAHFHQISVNAHIFQIVNNSLYMCIVNTLIEKIGLKPIEHGILDFVAMRLQIKSYKRYFLSEVLRINKSLYAP